MSGTTPGYNALREGAAWLDLRGRGLIRASGEDRARLLHAMTTNHVQQLEPGQWCYAFFLTAQGRIVADANIVCEPEALLIDTEPERAAFVYEHLDRFIIADDVTLEDHTEDTAAISVEGPAASGILPGGTIGISATGAPGVRFFVPAAEKAEWIARLEEAGAVAASPADIHAVRLEHARPRYGEDFTDAQIPHEVGLLGAVHFNKGCYLGQEIVERVRARGHANRLLTHFVLAAGTPPAAGTKLTAGGKEAGEVTSSAYSPATGECYALGYIRAEFAKPGTELDCGGVAAKVTELTPSVAG